MRIQSLLIYYLPEVEPIPLIVGGTKMSYHSYSSIHRRTLGMFCCTPLDAFAPICFQCFCGLHLANSCDSNKSWLSTTIFFFFFFFSIFRVFGETGHLLVLAHDLTTVPEFCCNMRACLWPWRLDLKIIAHTNDKEKYLLKIRIKYSCNLVIISRLHLIMF